MRISYPKLFISAALALFVVVLGGFFSSQQAILAQTQTPPSVSLKGDFDDDGRIDLRVGDVNRDGRISILDLTIMNRVILGQLDKDDPAIPQSQDYTIAGDVNGDGFSNFLDLTLIRATLIDLLLPPPNNFLIVFEVVSGGLVQFTGLPASVTSNAVVRIRNTRTGDFNDVVAASDGRFQTTLAAELGDIITVNQRKKQNDAPTPLVVRFRVT